MPAYAKVSLVTPVFHASDVAFVHGWSRAAPGIGGWTVLLDDDSAPQHVSVIPPGASQPVFFLSRDVREVLLQRKRPMGDDEEVVEIGRFEHLRDAVLALCPLSDEDVEDIQIALEKDFPRHEER